MSKSRDENLISPETEKILIDVGVDSGMLLVATTTCSQIPSTKEEKQQLKENLKLLTALSTSETEEELLDAFSSIDWSKATQAPNLVAVSMNQQAIRHAPIPWLDLEMPETPAHFHRHQPARLAQDVSWLSRKVMGYGNGWYEHLQHHSRYSDLVVRSQDLFWKTLVQEGKITGNSLICSTILGPKEKTKLMDVAMARAPESVCKMLLPTASWTSEEAEKSLACWSVATQGLVSYHQHKDGFVSKFLNKLLAAKPDATREIEMDLGLMFQGSHQSSRYWDYQMYTHREPASSWPLGYVCFVAFHDEVYDTKSPWGAKMGQWLEDYFQKEQISRLEKMMTLWSKNSSLEFAPSTQKLLAALPLPVRQVIFDLKIKDILNSRQHRSSLSELEFLNFPAFEGLLTESYLSSMVDLAVSDGEKSDLDFSKVDLLCSMEMKPKMKEFVSIVGEPRDEKRELALTVFRQDLHSSSTRPRAPKKKF